jgi:ABC-type phosphate/phosphonate transport system substrate-binding protein
MTLYLYYSGSNRSNLSAPLFGGQVRIILIRLIAMMTAIFTWWSLAPAFADQEPGLPKVLKVGFSSKVFPDIDNRDAKVAMELWARELSRSAGIPEAQVTIFRDAPELLGGVQRGGLHMVTMSAIEYLRYRDKIPLYPAFVAANKTGRNMEQLIIVHRNSGIQEVNELRGKSFAVLPRGKYEAAHIWLEVLLKRIGYADQKACFRQVKEFSKASQAIMGVFFRQVDGCVVSRGSFETCKTLNPQLGRELTIIAESKSLMGDVSCLSTSINESLKTSMDKAALHLQENSVGRQILTLFQIDRVVTFKNSDLNGTAELVAERERVQAKPVRKQ